MKVYELMEKLSKMPSGADVRFRTLMTLKEFSDCEIADSDDGRDLYAIDKKVSDADLIFETLVTISD